MDSAYTTFYHNIKVFGATSNGEIIMLRANKVIHFKCKSLIDKLLLSSHGRNKSVNVTVGITLDGSLGAAVIHFIRATSKCSISLSCMKLGSPMLSYKCPIATTEDTS